MDEILLGEGNEGRVYRRGNEVVKIFKIGLISDEVGFRLAELAQSFRCPFPEDVCVQKVDGEWIVRYPWFQSEPVYELTENDVIDYLVKVGGMDVIADNFKFTNLRRRQGMLIYIDIGVHIKPFNRSIFRDVCAKAFLLLNGLDEDRLLSEFSDLRQSGGVSQIPGFTQFYERIVSRVAEDYWQRCPQLANDTAEDVTLLIKCCAMDFDYLERQVSHIVNRLSIPRRFKEVVLSIDIREKGFLRQHAAGDISAILESSRKLVACGIVNRVIVAPDSKTEIHNINMRWFGAACNESHTESGIPVYSQLWAFEQIKTTYVLQADCDVLIYREDFTHDFLSEMIKAHEVIGVMGVGFNIPKSSQEISPYFAPIGGYKPEVRLGLFNLERWMQSLPWPNIVENGYLRYAWYQALHEALGQNGWRCLRGGDPRTVYIHPLNSAKKFHGLLDNVRRCVESGKIPTLQRDKWDLVEVESSWCITPDCYEIFVVIQPVQTSRQINERCVRSLAGQIDRDFGAVVIDDASLPLQSAELVTLLGCYSLSPLIVPSLREFLALSQGRFLIIHINSDEALMSDNAIVQLKQAFGERGLSVGTCFCDSDGLRSSKRFGLGQIYGGETFKSVCIHPRCHDSCKFIDENCQSFSKHPRCTTFDSFTEIPLPGSNIKPEVIAGFVVWNGMGGVSNK